jgi:Fe-S oxidoreductase
MNPVAMISILVAALAAFAWSANRRWQLMHVGTQSENRLDHLGERVLRVQRFGLKQEKMHKYREAGLAHQLIFAGFIVLLLRSLILWSRGFDANAGFWLFNPGQITRLFGLGLALGDWYGFLKDVFALAVIGGAAYFLYLRVSVKPSRMTLSGEGVLILMIILTMMFADILYDGSVIALHQKYETYNLTGDLKTSVDKLVAHRVLERRTGEVSFHLMEPAGSFAATILEDLPPGFLAALAQIGFWTHSALVLIFLNLLPHSKHFHIITAIPNIFTSDLTPPGRLRPIGTSEQLMEKVGAASETADPVGYPGIGVGRIEQFSWKAILDFYTCTECGRCSDNCPAHLTGKLLSPKHLTLDLRNHLYGREKEYLERPGGPEGLKDDGHGHANGHDAHATNGHATNGHGHDDHAHDDHAHAKGEHDDHGHDDHDAHHEPVYPPNPVPNPPVISKPIDLVVPSDPATGVIHPDVIWTCTSCRACEEQCPVLISYVDKITDMRRNVVMVRGEFPQELQRTFTAMETNGNPWNLSRLDRANWAEGLDVPTLADNPSAAVLYWVGCAASYDDRAKKIARATAKLLKAANVDFAILGQEENCTGDPARRAGNEFLFATLAEGNVATMKGYEVEKKKIISTCPHCFNTLANEYPDFGGKYEVVHHSTFLLELLKEERLNPRKKVAEKLVYHDSCYLGRYNDVYDAPREILTRIGAGLLEAEWSRSKGLCCGAGGAQMWMEEHGTERVNKKRTLQLLDTGAKTIASACPFCMTMLTDGLKEQNMEESIRQMDVAELLEAACALDEPIGRRAAMPQDPPRVAPSAAT